MTHKRGKPLIRRELGGGHPPAGDEGASAPAMPGSKLDKRRELDAEIRQAAKQTRTGGRPR